MDEEKTIDYLDKIYKSLDEKNKNIDNIIMSIDKLISEDKTNYLNNLLFPEGRKNAKIPDSMPLPSSTFQLHGTYLLTRMMHGDAVFSFNPFFLYNLSEGKYFVPYGKEVTNSFESELGFAYKIGFLTTLLKTSEYFSFFEFRKKQNYDMIQPVEYNQKILPIYSQYRLVSASICVKYIGPLENASGRIGGIIVNDQNNCLNGEGEFVGEHWGSYDGFGNFNLKYLDYNNVFNLYNYKEFDIIDGIRMVYYPIDNSYNEYVQLFNYSNINKVSIEDGRYVLKADKNYKNGFNFLIYIIGGPTTIYTKYFPLFKIDTYCNFECLPSDFFMRYIPVDININVLTNNEKKEVIEIIQGKSIKTIKEIGSLVSWKDYLILLKKSKKYYKIDKENEKKNNK